MRRGGQVCWCRWCKRLRATVTRGTDALFRSPCQGTCAGIPRWFTVDGHYPGVVQKATDPTRRPDRRGPDRTAGRSAERSVVSPPR
jgi:hypothetical protein